MADPPVPNSLDWSRGAPSHFACVAALKTKGIIDHTKSVWDNPTGYDRYDLGWDGTLES